MANFLVHISGQNGYQNQDVRVEDVLTQAKAKEVVAATHPGAKITHARSTK